MDKDTRESLLELYDPFSERTKQQGVFSAYNFTNYRMMEERASVLSSILSEWPLVARSSYLDVSCGRGESLEIAHRLRYTTVGGTEAVPSLLDTPDKVKCVLPDVPFGDRTWDVVSCLDVLEHILLEDWEASVRDLARVCGTRLILCVSNVEDSFGALVGHPLHVSRIPYAETHEKLRAWAPEFDWDWRIGGEGHDGSWFVGDRQ